MHLKILILAMSVIVLQGRAHAQSPEAILKHYEQSALDADKKFRGFSVVGGKQLYFQKEKSPKGDISCSTCHTTDPKATGRTRANKDIEPIAPSAHGKRFTDFKHVEKWFTRNCDDVLKRACSTQEKGDFITYLLTIK